MSTNVDSSDSDSEWIEPEDHHTSDEVKCLFCAEILSSAANVFDHCTEKHKFSIEEFQSTKKLDTFSYIKFINYLRKNEVSPEDVPNINANDFEDDSYMKPVLEEDLLLMFDIEEIELENDEVKEETNNLSEVDLLQKELSEVKARFGEATERLKITSENFDKIRKASQEIILSDVSNGKKSNGVDKEYFGSYSHFSIHQEMLSDQVRTDSYKNAILNNQSMFEGKTALDVGCGTGILSMFCASAGATKVYGVDQSDIIHNAIDIARENQMENKIKFIKGRMEDIKLPTSKVDIIVSEWMGYFLLFECMLGSIIYARDKYLAPNGLIFPDRFTVSIMGISDLNHYKKNVEFWNDVYGYKMSCMRKEVLKEGSIEAVNKDNIVTTTTVVKELNAYTCEVSDIEFNSEFQLEITDARPITAIVGYFDTFFDKDLQHKVEFSTSPSSKLTHWKQTVFCLPKLIDEPIGTKVNGKIVCLRQRKDPRSLRVELSINNDRYVYFLQ